MLISLYPMIKGADPYYIITEVSGAMMILGVVLPVVLHPFYVVWMRIAEVLAWVNTRLILSLIFLLMITPIGLIMKLLGKDPIAKRADPAKKSYWVAREKVDHPETMKFQF